MKQNITPTEYTIIRVTPQMRDKLRAAFSELKNDSLRLKAALEPISTGYEFAPDATRSYFLARDKEHFAATGECVRKHTGESCPVCGK